ncbi:MAG: alpha/beta hydrolase [Candidatus Omnitrophica bacterium]|nr:alpha/beta hydrolase [Candidatus Omnitrophota bacterium]
MRRFYVFLISIFITCVLIFIGSFIYLDKQSRKTFYYTISLEGHDVGTAKIDRYGTADKLIYKCAASEPLAPVYPDTKFKMVLDRHYNFEYYSKERSGAGAYENTYVENTRNGISFVSNLQSSFICISDIQARRGAFVFEEDAPITYLPMIENYDFRKGRSQGFNSLVLFSNALPPMKRFVTFTSVRDEYVKVGSRKIKTECLLVKIRNFPQATIWVSKQDKSLVMLEIPNKKLKITRTFKPPVIKPEEYVLASEEYISKDIVIKGKSVQLAGTLALPKGPGPFPAILLVPGTAPCDRNYLGLFYSISDYLAKKGYCVLRYDKRGTGESTGSLESSTGNDEIEDAGNALEYLASQKEVDPGRMAVIAYGRGSFFAIKASSEKSGVRTLVLISPSFDFGIDLNRDFEKLKAMAAKFGWSEDYLKTAQRSVTETLDKVKKTKHDYISVLRSRCFAKRMRQGAEYRPLEAVKKIEIPVLVLQGKADLTDKADTASVIDKTLEESGNKRHTLTYFSYLDAFLGKWVNDGIHKMHYEGDAAVLDTIGCWLQDNMVLFSSEDTVQK